MASGDKGSTYLSALEAAETYFPNQTRLVQRLFYVNEPFHSMCEDLADAAQALAQVEVLPEEVKEMAEAIAQSKVVVLGRPPLIGPKSS